MSERRPPSIATIEKLDAALERIDEIERLLNDLEDGDA